MSLHPGWKDNSRYNTQQATCEECGATIPKMDHFPKCSKGMNSSVAESIPGMDET